MLALPAEIKPAKDLTGPENVDFAILSLLNLSIVLACLLGQSIDCYYS
jgi:hypothetical protein